MPRLRWSALPLGSRERGSPPAVPRLLPAPAPTPPERGETADAPPPAERVIKVAGEVYDKLDAIEKKREAA